MANKTSKQCRERYINYTKFGLELANSNWNKEELILLVQLYLKQGPAWLAMC